VTKVARDVELDRLKTAQDLAFQRKQKAYQTQDTAWNRRSQAREALNQAHEEKQCAYAAQDASWQDYQRIRAYNGPRIDQLNSQQETAYENMKAAFDRASNAHSMRDGASARAYADEGHGYKAESQGYVDERRRLVQEIRDARDRHEVTKPAFQRAKEEFNRTKQKFDQAKTDHERAQADFKRAKADFDQAASAFRKRLEAVRAESKRKRDDKRSLAKRAGVPHQYRDNVWVSTEPNGTVNIYFGGVGKPNGPGHGHYVMDSYGNVTYARDPFDPHGAQNFAENRREAATLNMAQIAMNQWAKTQTTPWGTQYEDDEFKVQVKSGYDRRHDCIVTDLLIHDKQNKREHYHLVIDEYGNELFSEWRENRRRS
jgi:hypothetical protein